MNLYIFTYYTLYPLPKQPRHMVRGNKVLVGTVVKEKVGELEEEVREVF